jgi:4-alpha-glucanotransferase
MRLDHLRELARLCSIQLSYDDASGKKRSASRDALTAVLKARLPGHAKLSEALKARREAVARQVLEPVTVSWGHEVPLLEVRVPAGQHDARAACEITLESGDVVAGYVKVADTILLPRLPFGYHTLRLTLGGTTHKSALFVAPQTAHAPEGKSWGVFAPVYALRTARTRGIGDLGDLFALREWTQAGFVATLPMNAIFADRDPSPYVPVSRLFWNELYLDVRRLPEYRGEELPGHDGLDIDWKRVAAERHALLSKLAERFVPDAEFAAFETEARDYAEFRGDARYHLYVQYRMSQQLRALAGGLYLDFPLGVHPNGYDASRYAEDFATGVSVGAPPDLFFTKGQNWGFSPFDPDAIRAHRHAYFRACIRQQLAYASILRLDHVMGLHRLFWIPSGADATDGLYVRYPEEELYAVLTIESNRARSVIVGEDLGTVPQYVPRMMKRHGIRRMSVVQYDLGPDHVALPPRESIASVNTHDMPTFAGFWNGDNVGERLEQGLLNARGAAEERETRAKMRAALAKFLTARGLLPEETSRPGAVLEAVLRFLASSDAEMLLVNLEDLWLEREPVNRPGVADRSWRRRMRVPLEQARADANIARLLRMIDGDQKANDLGEDDSGAAQARPA